MGIVLIGRRRRLEPREREQKYAEKIYGQQKALRIKMGLAAPFDSALVVGVYSLSILLSPIFSGLARGNSLPLFRESGTGREQMAKSVRPASSPSPPRRPLSLPFAEGVLLFYSIALFASFLLSPFQPFLPSPPPLENAFSLCLFNFFVCSFNSSLPHFLFYCCPISFSLTFTLRPSIAVSGLVPSILCLSSPYHRPPPHSLLSVSHSPPPHFTIHWGGWRRGNPYPSPFFTRPISSSSRPKCAAHRWMDGEWRWQQGVFTKKRGTRNGEEEGGGQTGQGSQGQRPPSPTKLLRPFASAVGFPPNSCAYLLLPLPLFIFPLGRPSLSPSPCMSFYPISLFVVTI